MSEKSFSFGPGILGLKTSLDTAKIVIIPVPWDATASYGGGTASGPQAVLDAGPQVDLYDTEIVDAYLKGIHMLDIPADIEEWNSKSRELAIKCRTAMHNNPDSELARTWLGEINSYSHKVNNFVEAQARDLVTQDKIVFVLGGEHSVPFGAIAAASKDHEEFGILHIDAHLDLRKAYEGFLFSHASIMRNVLTSIPQVTRLVQVGIRDFCDEEIDFAADQKDRVRIFLDTDTANAKIRGENWNSIVSRIIGCLPNKVWVSFDIDGLDPCLCPHTGTPVPGGLSFYEALYLIRQIVESGKTIIGGDLCEVATAGEINTTADEWDSNVGMRILYKLCGWTLVSQKICKKR